MPFIEIGNVRLLYIHVPKTGGSTIEHWLSSLAPLQFHALGVPTIFRCSPQHLRMSDFKTLFREDYFDHVVMTIRNPYDRIVSEYRMQSSVGSSGFWRSHPSFSNWLENTLAAAAQNPFFLDNHIRPQWQFAGSGLELLKYESGMPAIVNRIAELLGVPPPDTLPRLLDTSTSKVTAEWDEIDRLRVRDFYRLDFANFDYEE